MVKQLTRVLPLVAALFAAEAASAQVPKTLPGGKKFDDLHPKAQKMLREMFEPKKAEKPKDEKSDFEKKNFPKIKKLQAEIDKFGESGDGRAIAKLVGEIAADFKKAVAPKTSYSFLYQLRLRHGDYNRLVGKQVLKAIQEKDTVAYPEVARDIKAYNNFFRLLDAVSRNQDQGLHTKKDAVTELAKIRTICSERMAKDLHQIKTVKSKSELEALRYKLSQRVIFTGQIKENFSQLGDFGNMTSGAKVPDYDGLLPYRDEVEKDILDMVSSYKEAEEKKDKALELDKLKLLLQFTNVARSQNIYPPMAELAKEFEKDNLTISDLVELTNLVIYGSALGKRKLYANDIKLLSDISYHGVGAASDYDTRFQDANYDYDLSPFEIEAFSNLILPDSSYGNDNIRAQLLEAKLDASSRRTAAGSSRVGGYEINTDYYSADNVYDIYWDASRIFEDQKKANPFFTALNKIMNHSDGIAGHNNIVYREHNGKLTEENAPEIHAKLNRSSEFKHTLLDALPNASTAASIQEIYAKRAREFFHPYSETYTYKDENGKEVEVKASLDSLTSGAAHTLVNLDMEQVARELRLHLRWLSKIEKENPEQFEKDIKHLQSLFKEVPYLKDRPHDIMEVLDPYEFAMNRLKQDEKKDKLIKSLAVRTATDEKTALFFYNLLPELYNPKKHRPENDPELQNLQRMALKVFSTKYTALIMNWGR